MALTDIQHGTHVATGSDSLFNSFPITTPKLNKTGIASQEVSLIDTQRYQIDIFNDFKSFKPRSFPFLTILTNVGGQSIDRDFDFWTDDYEGDDMVDLHLDDLRLRDVIGDGSAGSVGNPIAVGASGEIGGMLFFQKAKIGNSAALGKMNAFEEIADNQVITITSPGASAAALASASILESGLVPGSSDTSKKLLVLGFDRSNLGTGAANYQDTVGYPSKFIRKMWNVLSVREYTVTEYTCSWNGSSLTTYSASYVANQAKRVHIAFDDLEVGKASGSSVAQEHKIQIVASVDQFIWSSDLKKFVLVVDFQYSNLDYFSAGTIATSDITVPAGGGFYQVIQGVDLDCSSPSQTELNVGDVFWADAAATIQSDAATNEAVMTVPDAMLIEEVNTSVANAAAATDRIFGANVTSTSPGGHSRMMRHAILDAHDDLPAAAHEAQGFGAEQRGGYVFDRDQVINQVQFVVSKPWSVTTMRQATKSIRFQDDVAISRARHLKEYKKDWTNIALRGKKKRETVDGQYYKGSTSGILDFEMFPIKYMKHPIPVSGTAMDISNGGIPFRKWLNELARGLNSKNQVGQYEGHSLMVGKHVLDLMADANALIGTVTGSNVFGKHFQEPAPMQFHLGLQGYEYMTQYGILRFIHEPALDTSPMFKVPRFLFPRTNGMINPRYMIIAIDKSFISMMTHASRPDRVYGNLQANDNPFIYVEGISGGHLIKLRFPRNHAIVDITPDI